MLLYIDIHVPHYMYIDVYNLYPFIYNIHERVCHNVCIYVCVCVSVWLCVSLCVCVNVCMCVYLFVYVLYYMCLLLIIIRIAFMAFMTSSYGPAPKLQIPPPKITDLGRAPPQPQKVSGEPCLLIYSLTR